MLPLGKVLLVHPRAHLPRRLPPGIGESAMRLLGTDGASFMTQNMKDGMIVPRGRRQTAPFPKCAASSQDLHRHARPNESRGAPDQCQLHPHDGLRERRRTASLPTPHAPTRAAGPCTKWKRTIRQSDLLGKRSFNCCCACRKRSAMIASRQCLTSFMLAFLCAACATHSTLSATGAALTVQYTMRADTTARSDFLTPDDDAARALGIHALRDVMLPDRTREVRISDWYPMIAGSPVPVLRLVEEPGRPATGQVLFVWQQRKDWPTQYRATRCTPWANAGRTCAYVAPAGPVDWSAVARRLEDLGAWSISARCETDGRHVTDSGELLVSRLVGARFDGYTCNAPGWRQGSEAARPAIALYQYFHSLVRQVRLPPA